MTSSKKVSSPAISSNYAAPHTPIASVKRPRGKKEVDLSPLHPARPVFREDDDKNININSAPSDSPTSQSIDEDKSWVNSTQRKVNALFSPVLNFINGKDTSEDDVDVVMEDIPAVAADGTSSTIPSTISSTSTAVVCDTTNAPNRHTTTTTTTTTHEQISLVDADSLSEDNYSLDDVEDNSLEDIESEFNPYLFIKQLPAYEMVAQPITTPALPPKNPSSPPVSLILDLDETLVHCTVEPTPNADLVFPVTFNNISYQVHVKKRPHLESFLKWIANKFEVVVFTASQKVYADELLDRIDPERKYIQHRIFRDSCLPVEGNFLKDLNILGRCLAKTVLVDNSPHAFGYQVDNGIPIESWFDDPDDTELLKLEKVLAELREVDDVRDVVRKRFDTRKLIREA